MEPMSTKASRISNTGRKWINQSATKEDMNIPQQNKSMTWCAEVEIINVTGWSVGQGCVEYTFLVVGEFYVVW
jgi:hypothetical protein